MDAPANDHKTSRHHNRKRLFWGIVLIIIGTAFLLDRQGILQIGHAWRLWPFFIVAAGAADIFGARNVDEVAKGGFHIVLGLWLYACMERLWGITFGDTWPVLLIAYGVSAAVGGSVNLYKRTSEESSK